MDHYKDLSHYFDCPEYGFALEKLYVYYVPFSNSTHQFM